jgi:hypothetical protein
MNVDQSKGRNPLARAWDRIMRRRREDAEDPRRVYLNRRRRRGLVLTRLHNRRPIFGPRLVQIVALAHLPASDDPIEEAKRAGVRASAKEFRRRLGIGRA